MQTHEAAPEFITETRLVKTMMTGRPSRSAFAVAAFTLAVMILMSAFYWLDAGSVGLLLPAVQEKIFVQHQWWRIFSALAIHADIEHLLSNALPLSALIFFVYGYFGSWIFPVFGILGAALANLLTVKSYGPQIELMGASGLVYLLGGFWLMMYFFVQRQNSVMNRLLRVTGIAAVLLGPSTFVPSTSYRAHAIGFVFGIAMALVYFVLNKNKIRAKEVYKTTLVKNEINF